MAARKAARKSRRRQAVATAPAAPSATEPQTPPAPATHQSTHADALPAIALCALIALGFFPATQAGFVWDDVLLTRVAPLQHAAGLWQIWFEPHALKHYEGHYWPVLYTTFWLDNRLWGLQPLGYHLVNLALHAVVTLLLWKLLRRLAAPGAWLAAAVFALHPLHVESVVWVVGRKDLLAAAFYLGAAFAYIRFVQGDDPRRWWRWLRYTAALGLFALGALSKTTAVTLPAALLVWHWWRSARITVVDLARVAPFALLALGISLGDWLYYRNLESTAFDYSTLERALMAAQALWFYLGKLLLPTGLAVIYPRWEVSVADPLAWGYLCAALALAAALWFCRRRIGRAPLAAMAFFVVALSPTLGFVDFGYMQFSFVADRYQYLAGAAVIALVVGGAVRVLPKAWWTVAPAVVVLATLGALSWQQAGIYRHNGAYFAHITALNPHAKYAYQHLGYWLRDEGRHLEAIDAYREALKVGESEAEVRANIGVEYESLRRYAEAEAEYRLALAASPRFTRALNNLGLLLTRMRRYQESLAFYRRTLDIDPNYVDSHVGLGVSLAWLDRPDESLASLQRALELDPSRREQGSAKEQLASLRAQIQQQRERQRAQPSAEAN